MAVGIEGRSFVAEPCLALTRSRKFPDFCLAFLIAALGIEWPGIKCELSAQEGWQSEIVASEGSAKLIEHRGDPAIVRITDSGAGGGLLKLTLHERRGRIWVESEVFDGVPEANPRFCAWTAAAGELFLSIVFIDDEAGEDSVVVLRKAAQSWEEEFRVDDRKIFYISLGSCPRLGS